MMMFCKKSVHSFLGLTPTNTTDDTKPPCNCGLGLITSSPSQSSHAPNIIESSLLKLLPPPPPPPPKRDPFGFLDDIGCGVDGLTSCTESLGFESCDERLTDEQIDDHQICLKNNMESTTTTTKTYNNNNNNNNNKSNKHVVVREKKKLPPFISSLNQNGQPSFYLQPVRKDGRLELTEVRIHRPEILRASREDGRLRLHLIADVSEEEEDNLEFDGEDDLEDSDQEEEHEEQDWRLEKCHEVVMGHHHTHPWHVWRQPCCVTTR